MSTTTNLKLFKHDNPTTNTNQFDVEKALNENWDKLDANAGEVANRIQALDIKTNEKDTSQDTEIETLKAENTLLKSQIPSATVVGEAVHLEDSSNMPCQIMPLGASKQETREGYNKLKNSAVTQTINGVSFTVNKDGTVLVNGTATDTAILYLNGSTEYVYGAGTYRLSGCPEGGKSDTYRLDLMIHSNGNIQAIDTGDGIEFQLSEETILVPRIRIQSGFTATNLLFKPMIVEGTESKPYEQYGASPSIEFESPVESVGDNINLIDARYGVDIKGNDQYRIEVMPNTNYTLYLKQVCISLGDITRSQHWYKYCDDTDTVIKQGNILPFEFTSAGEILSGTKTFKTPENCTYIILDLSSYNSTPNTIQHLEVKLTKGTSTGAYSPYEQGSIKIYNCNKNLYDYINNPFSGKPISAEGIEGESNSTWKSTISYIKVINSNDVTISGYEHITWKFYIAEYDKNYNFIQRIEFMMSDYGDGYTFTTTERTAFIKLYAPITQITPSKIMVNIGGITNYVEHQSQTNTLYTQQPLRAIGDVKDRFVKKDGVWYERHPVGRYVFTGKENFAKSGSGYWYYAPLSTASIKNDNGSLSNYFVNGNWTVESKENQICISNSVQGLIGISTKSFASIEELKTFLTEKYTNGTPVYVDYILATPTLIECTPEQVEVLESFNTYKNVTNISSDSIGELEVFYYKDLETLIGGA